MTSTPIKPLSTEISTSPMLKSDELLSISETLKKSAEMPVTKKEEQIYKSVTKRKLFQSPQDAPIKCKTGGQPIYLMKVTHPRISTKKCVRETRFKRTKEIDCIRQNIAGPSTYDADKQLSTEVHTLAKKRKLHIKENDEINISDKMALSMKEELGLSWRQEGKHRKMMKKIGIKIKGDAAIRKLSKTFVTNFIQADMINFVVEKKEKQAALGYINNLQGLIMKLLDSYEEEGMLTWHDNTIPQDEIWIKLGGDHGKSSLKLTLQIANLEKPNAKRNVVVIGMAPIRDTYENLRTILNVCQLQKEIKTMESLTWNNKKIVFMLTGDYEFLTKIYGLSGAAGTFPCLWCVIPRQQLHSVKPNESVARSLEDLKAQNDIFVRKFKEDKKQAARCYNCIQLPLLDISLTHICPPYLHILLGLVKKHHNLLEDAVHELDLTLSTLPDRYLTEFGLKVKTYGKNWSKITDMKKTYYILKTNHVICDTEEEKEKWKTQARLLKDEMKDIEFENFDKRTGPVASSLDDTLAKHSIIPQSYHNRSFIGNHCHKYMRDDVYASFSYTPANFSYKEYCRQHHIIFSWR